MNRSLSLKLDVFPLLKLAYPLAIMGLVQSAVWFFETIFLAHLGHEILAAGSLVSWLFGTLVVVLFGLMSALNILVAHKHGAGDEESIAWLARDGIILSFLLAPFAIVLFWNISPIFLWFGQSQAVVKQADAYLHALSFGIFPDLILIACLEVIIGIGKTRVILGFSILTVFLNIVFSYLLIFGKYGFPALSIAGAGWGLTISYTVTVCFVVVFICLNKNYRKYFRYIFSWQKPRYLVELFQIGLPIGFMYCVEVAFFFALTLCMGLHGSETQAANQVALQYLGLCMSVMFAIAQGVTVRIGHLLGAENTIAASFVNKIGIYIALFLMIVPAILYCWFPNILIALDMDIHAAKNFNMVNEIKKFLIICAIFQFLEAVRIILFGSLRGLKETKFSLLTSLISFWGIALPTGYWLSKHLSVGAKGYWWAMIMGAGLSVFLLQWRFNIKLKKISQGHLKINGNV